MSTLTILEFSPRVNWHHGGTTASLRIKYSADFTDSDGLPVLRGLFKDVPCTVADQVLTVQQFNIITTNDALVNPLATCSAQFIDSNQTPREWLFQNFSIPQVLIPSANIGSLFTYNQGSALVRPPQFYLSRDETAALVRTLVAALGLGPATQLALGTIRLRVAAADPADPEVYGTNDPLVRDALKIMGVDLDATMASPADTNVIGYDAASTSWKPQAAAIPGPHAPSHELGGSDQINVGGLSGVLADPQTPITAGVEAIIAAQGAILADGSIPFAADESMGGFKLTDLATPDDLEDAANKDFVLQSVAAAVQQTPNITALVSGGGVLWEADYDFRVSQATYLIQGDLFASDETVITLDAADPTLDRIDVIALDNTGTVVKITGTAAAQPSQPDVDPGSQLLLTFVFVEANTTEPANVSNEDIYIDNTEWTATTSGAGWNVNSTTNPHSGTKDIEGTNVANNAFVQLEAPSPLTLDSFALLSVFIRSKAAWPKQRSLLFQWFSAGVAKGVSVTINTGFFGFDSSQVATYQLLAIPIAQFAVPAGTSINQLRITDKGGAIGMYLDDLVLQSFGGDIGTPPTPGLTQEQADARYLQISSNLADVLADATARTNIGAAPLSATPIDETGSPLTLTSAHNGAIVLVDDDVTVPGGLPEGFNVMLIQTGAAAVEIIASGTTINNRQSHAHIAGQFAAVTLAAYAADIFLLAGDTAT